eukprot:TRINITY_DN20137_c0_g1_i1.p1 TRINITY_DN20137_c0_g1~~TRINITY_DN20137_c0_g1_i1.p1  ORF type:complete len:477 (+),score=169.63 TRINITY_DN20137_c0_g1_i1:50-1480(+)
MQKVRTLAKHGPAADFAKGKQPPSYAVVSESELRNLKNFLEHDPSVGVKEAQHERSRLKEASQERVKHWPDLIETMRLKKEKDRVSRLEEEEEERKKIDTKEAEYQSDIRSKALNTANHILYQQDDRVKTFSSKLFLSHVLDERAKQVLLERQKKELAKQKDYEWSVIQTEQTKRAKDEEEEKLQKQRSSASKLKQEQKAQLAEIRARKIKEREEEREEGRQIREAAERAILKEKEAEEQKRKKAVEINRQYIDDNKRQRTVREAKMKEEEEELNKIRLFARLKEEQMLERKRRAEEKFNAQLGARQAMIDRQSAHLEALADEAEERVLTQMRDAERERDARELRESDKRAKLWNEIHTSRQKQLAMKEKEKEAQKVRNGRIQEIQHRQQKCLVDEEIKEKETARSKAGRLQYFQKLQMNDKEHRKKAEAERELQEGRMMLDSLQKEEDIFQEYISSVMTNFAKRSPTGHTPQPPP